MAEPLKQHFGPDIPRRIAAMLAAAWPEFGSAAFVADALRGYEPLSLTQRGAHIARAMRRRLPDDFDVTARILIASLGPKLEHTEKFGMGPFLYLPHVLYVAEHGVDNFEAAMQVQYELTQRFSAEFSIRKFLERFPRETLARLETWTKDPSPHVRRLVSEGTRPRLPWAPRLRDFQRDPGPVLALLELLKDDPELYVRRSVANNLNDIGKDHPRLLVDVARRWLRDATDDRRWIVGHALRSAVKRGDARALGVMGYGARARVRVGKARITPARAVIGGRVTIAFDIASASPRRHRVLVDFRIHFVKASGATSPKVFKLKVVDLAPRASVRLSKTVSLAEMTTRKHYPGSHRVDVVLNGEIRPLGRFALRRR